MPSKVDEEESTSKRAYKQQIHPLLFILAFSVLVQATFYIITY